MVDLYVYYKVPQANAARLEPPVRALLARLGADTGIHGQLKRRPESKDGVQTWMEVFPGVDANFSALLESYALEAGIAGLIDGPRRAEVFVEFTCA
ncbi:DUF4936 family protein [Massilia sp. IC2-278]|uniref:DUF4936 family protein n=1 Tax=Massilia sp. IC2-278 TaxID=2887200 RepID=UPI001E3A5241|nr:DUF4936 family protein [Massilia sp. IC2-278]MCC2959451.1 DUF4936 family protein [Massilia sp. IC2-278]